MKHNFKSFSYFLFISVSFCAKVQAQKNNSDDIKKITQYKARQVISAGGRDEEVIEKPEWGHSAFTKNLIHGLKDWMADVDNDGIITTQELGTFLKTKVTIDSNNQQSPKMRNIGDASDEGEFVFFQHTNNISVTSSINTIPQNTPYERPVLQPDLNWRNIRDFNFGIAGFDDESFGFIGMWGGFFDEGLNAWHMGFGVNFIKGRRSGWLGNNQVHISFKRYLYPYANIFFKYGFSIDSYYENMESTEFYYGHIPYIGVGGILNLGKFEKDDPILVKIMSSTEWNLLFGYRSPSKDAISQLNLDPGLTVMFFWTIFFRENSKSATVLPYN